MKNYLLPLCLTLVFTAPVLAEEQVITLKDGTQLKGELTSVNNGAYTVHTATMGDVNVNSDQVVSIAKAGLPALPTTAQPNANERLMQMQTRMMSNPEFMKDLQALAEDPEVAQLLTDPALVQAVMSKDVNVIQNNPKAQQLMDNPRMKAFMEKVRASQSIQ